MVITTTFNIKDRVVINGDQSVVATVQRIQVSGNESLMYEVSWFDSGGTFREHWLYDWQLTKKED